MNYPTRRDRLPMKVREVKSGDIVHVNQFYDVVAQNGIVVGSVKYAFHNGDDWCFSIEWNGVDAHGRSHEEYGEFRLIPGAPPWAAPVVQQKAAAPVEELPLVEHEQKLLPHS